MKPIRITLHPLSALAGAAACTLVVYTSSAQSASDGVRSVGTRKLVAADASGPERMPPEIAISSLPALDVRSLPRLVVEGQVGHPKDWVVIAFGVPFTVPEGKVLVVTGLGTSVPPAGGGIIKLEVDGVDQVSTPSGTNPTTIKEVPVGLAAAAGSTVAARGSTLARAWGYLVDE